MDPAYGYLRTSSAANIGLLKDSEPRQQLAIERFAKQAGYRVVDWYRDPAVSGADPIAERPGVGALLDRIEGNGVHVVLVEDASRFARDLITQELGVLVLIKRGVRVLTANGDDLTDDSDPARKMMRQVAGAFAEYEKERIVLKLRAARDRKRALTGRCEGRKRHVENNPAMVAEAKRLRRRRKLTLHAIARELAAHGWLNRNGRPFSPSSVRNMVAQSP